MLEIVEAVTAILNVLIKWAIIFYGLSTVIRINRYLDKQEKEGK